ncbi:MAG: hypothetical protein V1715_03460 [bacterium]
MPVAIDFQIQIGARFIRSEDPTKLQYFSQTIPRFQFDTVYCTDPDRSTPERTQITSEDTWVCSEDTQVCSEHIQITSERTQVTSEDTQVRSEGIYIP